MIIIETIISQPFVRISGRVSQWLISACGNDVDAVKPTMNSAWEWDQEKLQLAQTI